MRELPRVLGALVMWLLALAGVAAVSLALGALLPVDRLTPLFFAGALLILASIGFLRSSRDPPLQWAIAGGRPFWMPAWAPGPGRKERPNEVAIGVGLLALGFACWGLIAVLSRVLP